MRIVRNLMLGVLMTVSLAACGGGGGGSQGGTVQAGSPVTVQQAGPVTPAEPAPAAPVARSITLAWDSSRTSDGAPDAKVVGYKVHYGSTPGAYSASVTVNGAETTATLEGLGNGTYYMAVTAYDDAGNESPFSEEISATLS